MADLPAPTHSLKFGYWFDTSAPRSFDAFLNDYRLDVLGVVNVVVILAQSAAGDMSLLDSWFQGLTGKQIYYYPDIGSPASPTIDSNTIASIDTAAPYWSDVTVIMFDELALDASGMDTFIDNFNAAVVSRGLTAKPIYLNNISIDPGGPWSSSRVDIAGFEAYLDPSHQNDLDVVTQINNLIDANLANLGGKPCIITMMGYDRNGAWTNMQSLADIQAPVYLKAYNNSQIGGLIVFSFGRHGGTHFLNPAIRTEHLRIWGAITGTLQPDSISATQSFTPVPFNAHIDCGFFCRALSCNAPPVLAGLYKLIPGQKHDTLFATVASTTSYTTVDKPVPTPFIRTALIPSSDS